MDRMNEFDDVGILVVGHGTRKAAGADQLRQLVQWMREEQPGWRFYESFLELAEPSIEQAVAVAANDGMRCLVIVPILLFEAGHAKSDIPNAVAAATDSHGLKILAQTPSLGILPDVLELSNHRFEEIATHGKTIGCPEGHCSRVRCDQGCYLIGRDLGRIGLAMIGRGTSDIDALNQMRRLTELCVGSRSVVWYGTGFFAGGTPTVDGLLDEASQAVSLDGPCQTILVQPHLLFEGELMDQLRAKLLDRITRYPDRQWLLARSLGADRGLAKVFIDLVNAATG
jgi:sirohydrochlorin cobaltochelatase